MQQREEWGCVGAEVEWRAGDSSMSAPKLGPLSALRTQDRCFFHSNAPFALQETEALHWIPLGPSLEEEVLAHAVASFSGGLEGRKEKRSLEVHAGATPYPLASVPVPLERFWRS